MSSSQTPPSNETKTPKDVTPEPSPTPAQTAPFQRAQIVWGRPPQTVFRAGSLPRSEGMARLMAMPPHPQPPKPSVRGSTAVGLGGGMMGGGVMGGSNIPQGGATTTTPTTQTPAAKPAGASSANLMTGSLVPGGMARPQPKPQVGVDVAPDLNTTPEPAQTPASTPASEVPASEEVVIDSVLEPVVAVRANREVPRASVTATEPELHRAARAKRSSPVMIAVGALVLVAGVAALWWSQRDQAGGLAEVLDTQAPAAVIAPPTTPETVSETVSEIETLTPPVAQAVPAASGNAAPEARAPIAAPQAPVTAARPQSTPARPAPVTEAPVTTPQQVATPAPVIVVTPPAEPVQGPPPTVAAPVQNDPDAPVVTRPQRLD